MNITRRKFVKGAAAVLLGSLICRDVSARPTFTSDPFKLGVASGSPRPDSIVLWTRLAPKPLEGGGLEPVPIEVKWEIADDEAFHKIVKSGTKVADPTYAHSIHVEVNGLQPGRWYWYRFFSGDAVSPIGYTRTAPALDSLEPFRFSFASCQMYEQGYYTAHRHMAEENLDLVVFLGDYIYECSWGLNNVRKHEGPDVHTLEEYRNRFACYKSDPDLQRCHARFPWITTWDDHEVENDYANDRSQNLDPNFLARRSAAYQAYYEHMPLPESCAPHNSGMRIYDAYDFGKLTRFHVLDDRQYRDYQVSPKAGHGGSNTIDDCPERNDPKLTMLGWEQEDWLKKSLNESSAVWDVIVQQTLMAQVVHPVRKFWTDGWDGYPAARKRLLEAASKRPSSNSIVIGGDLHAYAVCDLKLDFDDAKSPTVATELCGTSISSQGPAIPTDEWLKYNPHIHYLNGALRGYVTVELGQKQADVLLRTIESEKTPETKIRTLEQYVVEKDRPGAKKV